MHLAISLARRANPSPNPHVGAVLIKQEEIIGQGFHKKAGLPHAEIEAINDAKKRGYDTIGSTLYVTLEPCAHHGKRTPPCVPAIIKAGIRKVVCAMKDPNPKVNGKGIEALENAGIAVKVGSYEDEAKMLNDVYIKQITTGLPFVTMKVAVSLDGKIATRTGDSKWISSEASRRLVGAMRDRHDGVMVGIGTILKDNPRLTCRMKGCRDPVRIIVDSKLRIPLDVNVLKRPNGMVVIGCGNDFDRSKKAKLERIGARVFVAAQEDGEVDLKKFMKQLSDYGITSILLEGGSALDGAMVDAKLVDKFSIFVAPKIIGGQDAKGPIGGIGAALVKNSIVLKNLKVEQVGTDYFFEGYADYR
ncbi:2,5-diamino-6-ribosylamino-4(3H)-pyrimidinone 5'-phosphate reductase [Candidatus Bilamarchaeum dharawalense]|uniref:5-amino-6-(5-phosphoribosylamino)uracil reductase n=1 Tax=Candidatus Bilamarchaeum dharawalense TaxID=2885759 RepID=A0A5E4LWS0_9ARCH|nr:2,5-diamino-6-ribosylamino-4(3H)-pyrimidinone 5'-phosphate reductase [Candidatus Bilamarchaeum dharawalense]